MSVMQIGSCCWRKRLYVSLLLAMVAAGLSGAEPVLSSGLPSNTVVTSSGSPTTYGHPVTFTAVVSTGSSTPTGTVEFRSGSTVIGSAVLMGSDGTASAHYTTTPNTLWPGTHSITAVYVGDSTSSGSTSAAIYQVVFKAILEVSGVAANNKVADGTVNAILDTTGAALVGLVDGDDVTLITSTATGAFDDPLVGEGKRVTISGVALSGASVWRYVFVPPVTVADITPKATLTVVGVTSGGRTYDGTTHAALNTSNAVLSGVVAPDNVVLVSSSATGSFADPDAGTDKVVTTAGFYLNGSAAGLYALAQPTVSASIARRPVTVSATTLGKSYGTADPSLTYTVTSGSLVSGDIFTGALCRAPGESVGTYSIDRVTLALSENYCLTYVGAYFTVSARPATLTFTADDKVYDGTIAATMTSWTIDGIINGDLVSITSGGAVFDTKHVGAAKTVSATGFSLGGVNAANYSLSYSTSVATVSPRPLTVTAAVCSKTYDGTVTCSSEPAVRSGDLAPGDTATMRQVFSNRNVGTSKTLTPAVSIVDGNDGKNYSLTLVPVTGGAIARRDITVTAVTDTKVYDGGSASSLVPVITTGTLGFADSAIWTQAFSSGSVGTGKVLTPAGSITDGNGGNNYNLVLTPVANGVITPKPLTVNGIAVQSKVYDGTTSATVNAGGATLAGVVPGDNVSIQVGSVSGTFASKHAGTNIQVAVSGLMLSGVHAGSYSLTPPTTGADITARPLTVTATADTRVYDRTVNSSSRPSITVGALQQGDTATWSQVFDTNAVGTGKTLSPRGSINDGNSGANYAVTLVTSTAGAISAKTLTVTGIVAASKSYDGTTTATLDTSNARLTGVISLDDVALDVSHAIGTFADKNVGTDKTVTIAGLALTGASAGNYVLTQPTAKAGISGVPVRLAFSSWPREARPGVPFDTQPVVLVQDSNGQTVTTASVPVTVALVNTTGSHAASLTGTATVNAVNGVATFSGLGLNLPGTALFLRATSGELTAATSATFDAVAEPNVLVFSRSPVGPLTRTPFTVQPVVTVQDVHGDTVTSSTATITLRIRPESGTPGATLLGAATMEVVDGVAVFKGLGVDVAGVGYILEATSSGLTPANSSSFTLFEPTPLPPPVLLAPVHLAQVRYPLHLDWSDAGGSSDVTYTIQIALDPSFGELELQETGLKTSSYTLNEPVNNGAGSGTPHYWRVFAVDSTGSRSEASDVLAFVVRFSVQDVPQWALSLLTGMGGLVLMGMGVLVVRRRKGPGDPTDEGEPPGSQSR